MSKFGQNWLIFSRYKLQNLLQLVLKYIPCKLSLNEVIPQSFHTNIYTIYRSRVWSWGYIIFPPNYDHKKNSKISYSEWEMYGKY